MFHCNDLRHHFTPPAYTCGHKIYGLFTLWVLLQHEKFQSAPGSRVGTPAYLAPEVIMTTKGQTYDGKVILLSLQQSPDCMFCAEFCYEILLESHRLGSLDISVQTGCSTAWAKCLPQCIAQAPLQLKHVNL